MKLPGGWWIGWSWVTSGGESSRTSALVVARHPRDSITWTFALYVNRRAAQVRPWGLERCSWRPEHGYAHLSTPLGGISWWWQERMPRPPYTVCISGASVPPSGADDLDGVSCCEPCSVPGCAPRGECAIDWYTPHRDHWCAICAGSASARRRVGSGTDA